MNKPSEAILKTITDKWEPIVLGCGEDRKAYNCFLCQMYGPFCLPEDGCPVQMFTSHDGCKNTPYIEWVHHATTHQQQPPYRKLEIVCPTCAELAEAEYNFLWMLYEYYKEKGE